MGNMRVNSDRQMREAIAMRERTGLTWAQCSRRMVFPANSVLRLWKKGGHPTMTDASTQEMVERVASGLTKLQRQAVTMCADVEDRFSCFTCRNVAGGCIFERTDRGDYPIEEAAA